MTSIVYKSARYNPEMMHSPATIACTGRATFMLSIVALCRNNIWRALSTPKTMTTSMTAISKAECQIIDPTLRSTYGFSQPDSFSPAAAS